VDQDAFDVRRGGGAGVEHCVVTLAKLGAMVGVVKVDHDVGRVEQDDQMLGQISLATPAKSCGATRSRGPSSTVSASTKNSSTRLSIRRRWSGMALLKAKTASRKRKYLHRPPYNEVFRYITDQ